MQDHGMKTQTFPWSSWTPGLPKSSWAPLCRPQSKYHWTAVPHIFTTSIHNAGTWGRRGGSRGELIYSSHNGRLIAAIWAAQLMLPSSSLAVMACVFLTLWALLLSCHQSILFWFFFGAWLTWLAHVSFGKHNPGPALPLMRSWCSRRLPGLHPPRRTRMTPHTVMQVLTFLSRIDPSRQGWLMAGKIHQSQCHFKKAIKTGNMTSPERKNKYCIWLLTGWFELSTALWELVV